MKPLDEALQKKREKDALLQDARNLRRQNEKFYERYTEDASNLWHQLISAEFPDHPNKLVYLTYTNREVEFDGRFSSFIVSLHYGTNGVTIFPDTALFSVTGKWVCGSHDDYLLKMQILSRHPLKVKQNTARLRESDSHTLIEYDVLYTATLDKADINYKKIQGIYLNAYDKIIDNLVERLP